MSSNAAVVRGAAGRLGVMVRGATALFVYWQAGRPGALALRVSDLSGRPDAHALDGTGRRLVAPAQQGKAYVDHLLPGHLYAVELGEITGGDFRPLLAAPPVQTPWEAAPEPAKFPFPAAYHRS